MRLMLGHAPPANQEESRSHGAAGHRGLASRTVLGCKVRYDTPPFCQGNEPRRADPPETRFNIFD